MTIVVNTIGLLDTQTACIAWPPPHSGTLVRASNGQCQLNGIICAGRKPSRQLPQNVCVRERERAPARTFTLHGSRNVPISAGQCSSSTFCPNLLKRLATG